MLARGPAGDSLASHREEYRQAAEKMQIDNGPETQRCRYGSARSARCKVLFATRDPTRLAGDACSSVAGPFAMICCNGTAEWSS
jgi:hypothetical protein